MHQKQEILNIYIYLLSWITPENWNAKLLWEFNNHKSARASLSAIWLVLNWLCSWLFDVFVLLLQWVLLQPPQPGARLLPEEKDGCAGLPPHLPHRQLPQSAGPHHGHQPHHGGNISPSITSRVRLLTRRCIGAGVNTFCFSRRWRAAKRWSWWTTRFAVKSTRSAGRSPRQRSWAPLGPTSPSSSTVPSSSLVRRSAPQTPVSSSSLF